MLQPDEGTPAPRYRFLRRVHSRNGQAYCVNSIYLDERVFRKAPTRFRRHTMVPVLLDLPGVRIAHAWQTLSIGTADQEVARLIGMPVNAPVAEVRRVCQDAAGSGHLPGRGHLPRRLHPPGDGPQALTGGPFS